MSISEELIQNIKDSYCETLRDKMIFITGYLANDHENVEIVNIFNWLLYSDKSHSSFDLSHSFSANELRNTCSEE